MTYNTAHNRADFVDRYGYVDPNPDCFYTVDHQTASKVLKWFDYGFTTPAHLSTFIMQDRMSFMLMQPELNEARLKKGSKLTSAEYSKICDKISRDIIKFVTGMPNK